MLQKCPLKNSLRLRPSLCLKGLYDIRRRVWMPILGKEPSFNEEPGSAGVTIPPGSALLPRSGTRGKLRLLHSPGPNLVLTESAELCKAELFLRYAGKYKG